MTLVYVFNGWFTWHSPCTGSPSPKSRDGPRGKSLSLPLVEPNASLGLKGKVSKAAPALSRHTELSHPKSCIRTVGDKEQELFLGLCQVAR